jgi:antitoxin (DNA-binding transcriptional repressor) of toxin-antitoxin stability system
MMSVSQARKQWFQLLGIIDETGMVALLTHRGRLTFALVPFEAARGSGVGIRKRGRPVAALVRLVE